jgi:uncharacterized lipoprotein YehR (DUF1307 family)
MNRLKIMRNIIYATVLLLAFVGCGKNSDSLSNDEKIAGKEEKTWQASFETNAEGDKDKLTKDEKKQSVTFWRNGNVRMGDGNQSQTGKWALQGNNLSLTFAGSDVSENFSIVELKDDEIKLRAPDGSELTMKPD